MHYYHCEDDILSPGNFKIFHTSPVFFPGNVHVIDRRMSWVVFDRAWANESLGGV